jgi:NADH dehydrogenase [ubiquinone] 1 alpha subcomplex assembly factor 7
MSPLGEKLISRIRAYGPMTVAQYMEACLSDPVYGYYMRREPFGRYGDFVTAPEVSQIFGELIGVWTVVTWEAMGSPRAFVLAELGPGRGTLMADMLRVVRVMPAFAAAAEVHLVETSPRLRAIQQQTLAGCGARITWHAGIDTLPAGPLIVVANEFFDALPIRQFRWGKEGWAERMVGLDAAGRLTFGLRPVDQRPLAQPLPDGAVVESSPVANAIVGGLAGRFVQQGGALLAIDYGSDRPGYGDTLQAVKAHKYVDPLHEPGEADLTAHVDFANLARAAATAGAKAHPVVSQGEFLKRLGIGPRAEALAAGKDEKTRDGIRAAMERLTGAGAMGDLFKVLAVGTPGLPMPAFDGHDARN